MSFFQAGPLVLALWGREEQIEDAGAGEIWTGNGGIVVAQNVGSEAEVDAMMARAEGAGARILKPATKTFWGGYNGYFADPRPCLGDRLQSFWQLDADGRVQLPE